MCSLGSEGEVEGGKGLTMVSMDSQEREEKGIECNERMMGTVTVGGVVHGD